MKAESVTVRKEAQRSCYISIQAENIFQANTCGSQYKKGLGAMQECPSMQTQSVQFHLCGFGFNRRRNSEDKPNNLLKTRVELGVGRGGARGGGKVGVVKNYAHF